MNKFYTSLIFLIGLICLVLMRLILGFDGAYGQDSYEYVRYTEALKNWILNGQSPGDYFWPVGYPIVGALVSCIVGDSFLALQLVSAISSALVLIFTYRISQLIYQPGSKNPQLLMVALMALSPYFLRFSISNMADMFSIAMLLGGFYYVLNFIQQKKGWSLVLSMFLLSGSFMSRYAVIVIIIPFILFFLVPMMKTKSFWIYMPIGGLLACLPILPHYLIRTETSFDFTQHPWLMDWSPTNFFKSSFNTADGISSNKLPNVVYSLTGLFHPRYFCFGLLFVLIGFRKLRQNKYVTGLLISLLIYLIFLAGIPIQNPRFLLPGLPLLMILLYPCVEHVVISMKKIPFTLFTSTVLSASLFLSVLGFRPVLTRFKLEKKTLEVLDIHGSPNLYTMDIDVSLKARNYSGKIYNIFTDLYDEVEPNSLIIFNTSVFPKQWIEKNPMKNWEHFNQKYTLVEVEALDKNWKIYKVE